MSDQDRRDKAPPDYDLTTPNLHPPQQPGQGPPRPTQTAGPDDRTAVDLPLARPEGGPPPNARPRESQPNRYDLTAVNLGGLGFDDDDDEQPAPPPRPPHTHAPPYATEPAAPTYDQAPTYGHPQAAPTQSPTAWPQATFAAQPAAPRARRGVPAWVWLGLGGLLLLAAGGAAAYFLLSPPASFTLRIVGAPPGSKVYIDDLPSGVPQRDGSIIVQGLRAGEPREVRVTQEGHAEWRTSVTGEGGETQNVSAVLTPLQSAAPTLPPEIEYDGKMLLVAAGPFTMGFEGAGSEEAPAHSVELPAFYIDKFEVTNEQYAKFCEATGEARPVNPFWDQKYFEANPRMPVVGVSYAEAAAYAAWAGKRLPIEAEWEKAASWGPGGAEKRQYPWGGPMEPGRANLQSEHPTEVGSHPSGASAYGVLDMAGNVREWVDAFFAPYPGGVQTNPNYGRGLRVVRGGDFRAGPQFARTTARLGVAPEFKTNPGDELNGRSSLVGFRCAISADDARLKPLVQKKS